MWGGFWLVAVVASVSAMGNIELAYLPWYADTGTLDGNTNNCLNGACVLLQIRNIGDDAAVISPAEAPVVGVVNSDAHISICDKDGARVPFAGYAAKYSATASVTVEAGKTVWVSVDLSVSHALSEGAEYIIGTRVGHALHSKTLDDVAARFTIVPRAGTMPRRRAAAQNVSGPFTDCTSPQTSIIVAAVGAMRLAMTRAYSEYVVDRQCSAGAHYVQWFGLPTPDRVTDVFATLLAIASVDTDGAYDFDCQGAQCSPSTYAYVYASGWTVYLCSQFWNAPAILAADSRPGVLVHEFSHFHRVGATVDAAYGQTNAARLAEESPDLATNNADSFEYFVELLPDPITATDCDYCSRPIDSSADECTERPGCGFCNSSDTCVFGDPTGPYRDECNGSFAFNESRWINTVASSGSSLGISAVLLINIAISTIAFSFQ